MNLARLGRLRPSDERFAERLRTRGTGELAAFRADLDEADVLGDIERDAGPAGERALHELRPDRQRRLRAAQADGLIVVEAHPHHREELASEDRGPRVANVDARARLAGRVERVAGGARTGLGPFA